MQIKPLIWVIVILSTINITGCQKSKTIVKLTEVDSLLNREQQDSAVALIKTIQSSLLSDEEKAYHNLLETRILYRKDSIPENDDMIDQAIEYYNRLDDKEKIADCYYYKAGLIAKRNQPKEAIILLKKAEELSVNLKQKDIVHKVYEKLSLINERENEFDAALDYARKALKVSGNNKNWQAYAYNFMAFNYMHKEMLDSSLMYFHKLMPLMQYMPEETRYRIYGTMGLIYQRKKDSSYYGYIKPLFEKKENYAYVVLGCYYQELQKYDSATYYLDKAMENATNYEATFMLEWKFRNLARLKNDSITKMMVDCHYKLDSIYQKQKSQGLVDIQKKYDNNILHQKMERKITLIVIFGMGIILLIIVYLFYQKDKVNKAKQELLEKQLQMETYQRQLLEYQSGLKNARQSAEENLQTINALQGKIKALKQEQDYNYSNGKSLYDAIENGGNTLKWKRKEFERYNEYFALSNQDTIKKIKRNYKDMSAKLLFMIILRHQGKSESVIKDIMVLSDGGYRTAKSRIKAMKK